MGNPEVPMLFSNATNWYGKPFMRLTEYLSLKITTPKFSFLAQEIAKEKF